MTIFLLKLTLAWGFFALLYALLLKQETFFRANRLYLLSALTFGLLLALPAQWWNGPSGEKDAPALLLPAVAVGLQQADATVGGWPWLDYLWVVYWAGAGLAFLRLAYGLARIAGMIVSGRKESCSDGCVLVKTTQAKVPFSFFRWIFLPAEPSESFKHSGGWKPEKNYAGEAMLAHERAHARDWHSADVLLVEALCVIFWFHPLAHWYRRAIRKIHEYLADAEASRLTDRKQYGLLLIRQAQSGVPLAFVNHFFQSPLKQRLIMLTRNASPALRVWKYGLVLPVFTLLFLFMQQTSLQAQKEKKSDIVELSEVEQMPEFPGGQEMLMKFLAQNIRYPEAARRENAQGMVVVSFMIDEHGKVSDVKKPDNAKPEWRQDFIDETIRVAKLMPDWKPAVKDGKPVKVTFSLPVKFKL